MHILNQIFSDPQDIDDFFEYVKSPEKIFTLRVNTTKISQESLIDLIFTHNLEVKIRKGPFYNNLIMDIEGPFDIPVHSKKILIDRYAAESVMKGADLFFPGVKHPEGKVKKEDFVSLVNLNDGMVVAEAISQ